MDHAAPTLLWFRRDLRLADNPALAAALKRGRPVVPVWIQDDAGEGPWPAGGASRWWLHHSLKRLAESLRERGADLVIRRGDSAEVIDALIKETGADAVYWNRRYEPEIIQRDTAIKATLRGRGIDANSFNAALLFEPTAIRNRQGNPFQVFTPFWRHCLTLPVEPPIGAAPKRLPALTKAPRSLAVEELELLPRIPWDAGLAATWQPGEASAQARFKTFLREVENYADQRDLLTVNATSRLSPHLHFGEIGPRQIWAAIQSLSKSSGVFPAHAGAQKFLAEVGWREFAHHLLFHYPHTPEQPLRENFARFPWRKDPGDRLLKAWQKGRTGYPIVDAAMRELWQTGWMPNRLRMVVGSFLVKHLRLPWQTGAAWFWDTLVDADLANNTLGWQWIAGCGADAAPYFRIFAPVLQSQKFDPKGEYMKRWLPELAKLPANHLHAPWEAPENVLSAAGVELGRTYPRPIVDHATARAEALAAYQSMGNR